MLRIAGGLCLVLVLTIQLAQEGQLFSQSQPNTEPDLSAFQMPAATVASLASRFPLSIEQRENDWIALFDGKSMMGWKAESDVDWTVSDSCLVASKGTIGLLRTTSQFDDYHLSLEYKCPDTTNSGIFLRTSPHPKNPSGDCYELNIAPPNNPFPSGSLVGRRRTEQRTASGNAEKWHNVEVTVNGGKILAQIDGVQTINYTDPRPLGRGYIGLQFNAGKIAFRNIILKPLNLEPTITADLKLWNVHEKGASRFTIKNELEKVPVLKMVGGPGQLETNRSYADFVFQSHCKTNAAGLNSGIFFRCIPGEKMNGYESQIQNQFNNNDPRTPKDCGTGGIFRRQQARVIAAIDKSWFSKTIVATGPHISVWVNGLQVSDWTDTRKPNANPRKGLRLLAGTIILQGHDPTTNLSFRKIRVKELTERRPVPRPKSN